MSDPSAVCRCGHRRDQHEVIDYGYSTRGVECTECICATPEYPTEETPMTTTDTTVPAQTRYAFWIDPTQPAGHRGFIPSVVFEGVSGHYPMVGRGEHAQPWYWGDIDTAKRLAADENAKLGLTEQDVSDIIISSMFAENVALSVQEAAHARFIGQETPPVSPMEALIREMFQ